LQCLGALATEPIEPLAVLVLGPPDLFAVEQVRRHWRAGGVFSLTPPAAWTASAVAAAAAEQRETLVSLRDRFSEKSQPSLQHCPDSDAAARDALIARDRRVVWHPYTSLGSADEPLVCVGARDEFLFTADGRQLIDAISSWWTILHGHRHPVLMAALRDACTAYDHVHFAGVTHAPAVELAEMLLQTAPWPGGRVFYSDNGSTAVEVALKMAYQFWADRGEPQRTRFVGFEHGYHGDTFGAMAVGRDPVFFGRFEPLLFRASVTPLSAERLDATLTRHRGEVAGVIVEPLVQGAGGMRMHTPAELSALAEVTRRHGVLFIADEVMTGGGRTGTLWAHQAAGVSPDLICASKTLTGGVLPLAATLISPGVAEAWQTADPARTFFHGHSFTAHPLACSVAVANFKMLTAKPDPRPQRIEAFWNAALSPLRAHAGVSDVRIRGSIAAIELSVGGGYLADVGRQLRRACLERGVLCRPLGNVLYTMPPLATTPDSLARIADAMTAAVNGV
jgi:adenosylmethionine-8-amino-7-oxononanoate aminotransferase